MVFFPPEIINFLVFMLTRKFRASRRSEARHWKDKKIYTYKPTLLYNSVSQQPCTAAAKFYGSMGLFVEP
ncbi:hypothetical protein Csa_006095 [Cucumis sativus]|uniref:Uncharacterized protein n=1 Tax=Cucumis sativus TaxID=3659 RepID=A0A0A0LNT1_CUCSA|nr:hypothetical protein Csa_006095 [Cucumis sativus]